MKERIVITDDKFVRQAHNSIVVGCPLEFEQVPENLGQVAFLLRKKLEEKKVEWNIENHTDRYNQEFRFMGILFGSNKTLSIKINNEDVVVLPNISYPLMWQIIKSLIGEE